MNLVSWNTTKRCNLSCKHCYRESGPGETVEEELTTAEGLALIKQMNKAGFKLLILSGGEPLLRSDIFEFVRMAKQEGMIPAMGTNGTLLTKEAARELKDSGLRGIAISVDSLDKDYHDEFRGMKGAYDQTQLGIENALEAGLRVQINLTLTEKNESEFEKMVDFYEKRGVHAIHPFFLVPTGRGEDMEEDSLKKEAYFHMIRKVLEKQGKTSIELKPTCAPQFMAMAKDMGIEQRFTRGCLAGISYCSVLPKGEVNICPYLGVEAGNVRQQPFDVIWKEAPVFKQLRDFSAYEGECGKCEYIGLCGGCRARAYYYNKSYMAQEPWCYRR